MQTKKTLSFLLKLLLTAGIFYFILKDAGNYREIIRKANPLFITAAFLFLAGQVALTALRWKLLLKALSIRISYLELLSLTYQGCFFALFIPGGVIGGDLIKAGILVKRSEAGMKFNGAFSIFMDRFCGMLSLFSLMLLVPLIFKGQMNKLPPDTKYLVYTLVGCSFLALCAASAFFLHDVFLKIPFIQRIYELLNRYSKDALAHAIDAMQTYRKKAFLLLLCVVMGMFIMFPMLMISLYMISCGTTGNREKPIPFPVCALASTAGNTAGALPLTPGGLGTRDYICMEILKGEDGNEAEATAITLLFTGIFVVNSLFGGLFFILDNKENKAFQGKKT